MSEFEDWWSDYPLSELCDITSRSALDVRDGWNAAWDRQQERIKELEADRDNWKQAADHWMQRDLAVRKLAQAVVDSKRGMGHLVPSSVGWAIEELAAALEKQNE